MGSVISALWNWIPSHYKLAVLKKKFQEALLRPFINDSYEETLHVEEDWDNLVILDGCRFDMFRNKNFIQGELSKVYSAGSHTWEFMRKNFQGDQRDTVYISANPQLGLVKGSFAEVYNVWEESWDEDLETVPPENVTRTAEKAVKKHPNKRIVVHYMQPHYPFIGSKGRRIQGQGSYKFLGGKYRKKNLNIWEMLFKGMLELEEVEKAYVENLEEVLEEVPRLNSFLEGKTVVTSDHGNLLGKRVSRFLPFRVYGHPMNFHDPDLTAVPWLELPFDKRREIEISETSEKSFKKSEKVKKRLKDLGYIN